MASVMTWSPDSTGNDIRSKTNIKFQKRNFIFGKLQYLFSINRKFLIQIVCWIWNLLKKQNLTNVSIFCYDLTKICHLDPSNFIKKAEVNVLRFDWSNLWCQENIIQKVRQNLLAWNPEILSASNPFTQVVGYHQVICPKSIQNSNRKTYAIQNRNCY